MSGIAHELTGQYDMEVIQGIRGLQMPPVDIAEDQIPGLGYSGGGARLREYIYTPSEVELPIFLRCVDYATLWRRHQELTSWFRIRRTRTGVPVPGQLMCINPSGQERQLHAVYVSGLEGDQGRGTTGPTYRRLTIVLRASDPLWYARSATSLTFSLVGGLEFFAEPFLPLKLTSGIISAEAAQSIRATMCWPVWHIVGPGVNPAHERDHGQVISTYTLAGRRLDHHRHAARQEAHLRRRDGGAPVLIARPATRRCGRSCQASMNSRWTWQREPR